MPSLLVYYVSIQTENTLASLCIVLALVAGTFGDILLTKGHRGKSFFWGMFSFFVGHIFYMAFFILHLESWGYFLFAMLALCFPLYKVILSFFPSKETPLLSIYAVALITLIAFTASASSFIAMLGVIFFGISGYLIAMDVVEKHVHSDTAIMSTYSLAQLLLIVGALSLQGVF